jgi:cystathionine beta-lyase/cystathionine gamma-synthase
VSWGGVESVVIAPNRGTNASYLASQRIPPGLVRVSVGLEGAEQIVADLEQALRAAELGN